MYNKVSSKIKHTNIEIIMVTFFITIFVYIAYLLTLSLVNVNKDYGLQIFLLSWLGILFMVFIVITWYKLTGTVLSPYTIFMSFFFVFNFGQCFMWAFGVHISSEIGKIAMYDKFAIADDADIIKAQALTLICILMFHFGAVSCYKPKNRINFRVKENYMNFYKNEDSKTLKAIYYSCLIMGVIVIPIALYYVYSDFLIARVYGYAALYYSEYARTSATFPMLLSMMFFPCLVGLLIGSKYNRKVQKSVYTIFLMYLIIDLISGDRGSWIYRLFILIWLSNECYKPINFKTVTKYLIIGIIGLYMTNVIVSFRSVELQDINIEKIVENISFENSPIISGFFEMGESMQPTIILQKYGWNVWPYDNTYLLAILGMITNKLIYALNIPFDLLSSWFSQVYLYIPWGAGFSIIAEALLNGGPFLAPLFMIVQGYIITSMMYIDKGINYKERPLRFFFAAATLDNFISITRNELHPTLKNWFYGVVVLYFFILIIRKFVVLNRKLNIYQ